MVKLIVEGVYIDLDPTFAYETKKAHPITNGLSNVYSAYSTDIQLPLTEVNVKVFDYSMLRKTTKVHKKLKGYLVKGTEIILVDVIVKKFTPKGITIYIIEKISDQLKSLIDGVYMLDEMNEDYEDKQIIHKVVGNLTPNTKFTFAAYDTQEKEFPSINIQDLKDDIESNFGLTINMPVDFDFQVFCNKAKFGFIKNVTSFQTHSTSYLADIHPLPIAEKVFCINNLLAGETYDPIKTKAISLSDNNTWAFEFNGYVNAPLGKTVDFYVANTLNWQFEGTGENTFVHFSYGYALNAGDYLFSIDVEETAVFTGCWLSYYRQSEVLEEVDMDTLRDYFFDTYYNLPKITVLAFLKAVALTNGYTLTFENNEVNFKDLADYFDVANAVDMSDYFLSATQEEFTYLKYQKNNIRYGTADPYATIEVADDTLEKEGDFLVIQEVIPTDNNNVQLWDYSDPEKPKIREGIATVPFMGINLTTYNLIAQYLDEAFVYTAMLKPCNLTGAPIYLRQLNGIYLPTEITERTSGTELKNVTTKLLKL